MKPSERLRLVMKDKKITSKELAERSGRAPITVYGMFSRDKNTKKDGMTYRVVEELVEAMGCEIVIRDKETGKEY